MLDLVALGSGADGDGGSIRMAGKSSTTADTDMGYLKWKWGASGGATHASRFSRLDASVFYTTTEQVGWSMVGSSGGIKTSINGATPVLRATTGGAAAAFTANTSGISDDTATFGGYTIGQIAQAIIDFGILT